MFNYIQLVPPSRSMDMLYTTNPSSRHQPRKNNSNNCKRRLSRLICAHYTHDPIIPHQQEEGNKKRKLLVKSIPNPKTK
jgi:hypothetical protein